MQRKPPVNKKGKRTADESSIKAIHIIFAVAIGIGASIVHQYYPEISDYLATKFKTPLVWVEDPTFKNAVASSNAVCDFQQVDIAKLADGASLFTDDGLPVIVKGAASHWKATEKWQKENLLALYGNRTVSSGSESSIVYSGGSAAAPIQLHSLISKLTSKDERNSDHFVFDATIVRSIPELMNDVEIFKVFQEWDNPTNEKKQSMWHMLSLGPSQSGLPFHSHGKTWLAIVHGTKQWYVYPPGYSEPPALEASVNPLLPVIEWFNKVLPSLKTLPKPPLTPANRGGIISAEENERGFQPLQCIQEAGDLVFLPARWSHLTLNLDETIAIGGQASLGASQRHASASETLKNNPLHYESLKDVGLGQAHIAMERTRHIQQSIEQLLQASKGKKNVSGDKSLILQIQSNAQLKALLTATHDSWLVLYVVNSDSSTIPTVAEGISDIENAQDIVTYDYDEILSIANQLNALLEDKVNVAIFDSSATRGDSEVKKSFTIRLHGGDALHTPEVAGNKVKEFQVDVEGTLFEGVVGNTQQVVDFVDTAMKSKGWQFGSVNGVTVMVQNMFKYALASISKAVELKPLHPEARGLLGEMYGVTEDFNAMRESISASVALYDNMDRDGITLQSIASVYHKLATIYLSKELTHDALPLLQKSLTILPDYLPAIVDLVMVDIMNGDKEAAIKSLKRMVKESPHHPFIGRFSQTIKNMGKKK